jgi:hypothetical protein
MARAEDLGPPGKPRRARRVTVKVVSAWREFLRARGLSEPRDRGWWRGTAILGLALSNACAREPICEARPVAPRLAEFTSALAPDGAFWKASESLVCSAWLDASADGTDRLNVRCDGDGFYLSFANLGDAGMRSGRSPTDPLPVALTASRFDADHVLAGPDAGRLEVYAGSGRARVELTEHRGGVEFVPEYANELDRRAQRWPLSTPDFRARGSVEFTLGPLVPSMDSNPPPPSADPSGPRVVVPFDIDTSDLYAVTECYGPGP